LARFHEVQTDLVETIDELDNLQYFSVSGAALDEATEESVAFAAGNGKLAVVLPQDLKQIGSQLKLKCLSETDQDLHYKLLSPNIRVGWYA
jgi:hypothetical protein